jgi:cytochrome c nitrite reductase small subunit
MLMTYWFVKRDTFSHWSRRWLQPLAIFYCIWFIPSSARAQQNVFQQDPVDHYGSRFLAVVIILGMALVLFNLFRYRGVDSGASSWAILIAGTAVFPIILSGFGNVLVFERAKTVQLCGSCHLTMKSYVDDMENPQSNSLAAVHYNNRYIAENQCYECHTSYGMSGTIEAKEQGMVDVYRYYTHTFRLPLKLRHPYRDGDCLKCHAEAVKWVAAHQEFQQDIFAGKLSCMQCHGESNPAHKVVAQELRP